MRPSIRTDKAPKWTRNADQSSQAQRVPSAAVVPLGKELLGRNVLGQEGEDEDDDEEGDDVDDELSCRIS